METRRSHKELRCAVALSISLLAACGTPPKVVPPAVLEAREGIQLLSGAVENYVILNEGEYPYNLEILVITDQNKDAFLTSRKSLVDPWGRAFFYDRPRPDVRGCRIFTYGRDGIAGGAGVNADLDNWMIADGELRISHEHFGTFGLGEVLSDLDIDAKPDRDDIKALLATLPGGLHGLGLVMAEIVLRAEGVETVVLGADNPLREIASTAKSSGATHIALGISRGLAQKGVGKLVEDLMAATGEEVQ
jgi:hypothetical protein